MLCPPIEKYYGRENCLIDPYTLGVWLGDGHWGSCIGITSMNPDIIAEVEKFYKVCRVEGKEKGKTPTYFFKAETGLKQQLAHYGLTNKKSGTKFIPKQAMLSDLFYRQKVLAGLIDTDGYYTHGGYSITTKSERMANDILELVRTIGGMGSIRKVKKGIKATGFVGEYYAVGFRCPDLQIILKYKQRTGSKFYLSDNREAISVAPTKEYGDVWGIELDSPSQLYITNNYAVTHNSGKTTFAFQLCKAVDPTFNIDRVCFNEEQFNEQVLKCAPGQAICLDEAMNVFFKRTTMSATNILMVRVLAECRKRNLFMLFVMPSFFEMDRYPALHRASCLIHIYTIMNDKGDADRGYFRYYDKEKKKMLYLEGRKSMIYTVAKPNFFGRFTKSFPIPDKEYQAKKDEALLQKNVVRNQREQSNFQAKKKVWELIGKPSRKLFLQYCKENKIALNVHDYTEFIKHEPDN